MVFQNEKSIPNNIVSTIVSLSRQEEKFFHKQALAMNVLILFFLRVLKIKSVRCFYTYVIYNLLKIKKGNPKGILVVPNCYDIN